MPLNFFIDTVFKIFHVINHKTLTKHGLSTIQGNLLILNVSFATCSSQCQYPRYRSESSISSAGSESSSASSLTGRGVK